MDLIEEKETVLSPPDGIDKVAREIRQVIEAVCDKLDAEFGNLLRSVVLTGSTASGNRESNSDIDLLVLVNTTWSQGRHFRISEFEVDIRLVPLIAFADECLRSEYIGNCLKFGVIVLDRRDTFSELRKVVNYGALQARRRDALPEATRAWIRYQPFAMYEDIQALVDAKDALARLILDAGVLEIVGLLFLLDGHDIPKISRRCSRISETYPELSLIIASIGRTENVRDALAQFKVLATMVTDISGGAIGDYFSPKVSVVGYAEA